jgi:small GTP-binding protein
MIILVGDAAVGKTTLFHRYKFGVMPPYEGPTIGSVCHKKTIKIDDSVVSGASTTVHLTIFDTAGSMRFRDMLPMYFRGASSIMLCFEDGGLDALKDHVKFIRDHTKIPIVLVVTKVDGYELDKFPHIRLYAESNGFPLVCTSSVSDLNIDEAFTIAAIAARDYLKTKNYTVDGRSSFVKLEEPKPPAPSTFLSWC